MRIETSLQKRRVITCNDRLWEIIDFLEDKLEMKESEVVRIVLGYLSTKDRIELLKYAKEKQNETN